MTSAIKKTWLGFGTVFFYFNSIGQSTDGTFIFQGVGVQEIVPYITGLSLLGKEILVDNAGKFTDSI